MNTTQTLPPPPAAKPTSNPSPSATPTPTLSPLARAILADWDNPSISELDLADRHGLTLEALYHHSQTPAFRAALALRRKIRADRAESYLARAQDHAADVFTLLSNRPPDSATAAKEIRLALKELLRLRARGAGQPDPADQPDPPSEPETPPMQPADSQHADPQPLQPPQPREDPTPIPTTQPLPTPHKPKSPTKAYKPRPKPKSR